MKGIFCTTTARTNEEYRQLLKKRNRLITGLILIGLMTLGIALFAYQNHLLADDHTLSFYSGVGTGLTVGGLLLLFRNLRTLKDEHKLKTERLKNSDERLIEISSKAFRTASTAMLIAAYFIGLIGGLYEPVLFKVLWLLVTTLLLFYIGSYRYYEKKM